MGFSPSAIKPTCLRGCLDEICPQGFLDKGEFDAVKAGIIGLGEYQCILTVCLISGFSEREKGGVEVTGYLSWVLGGFFFSFEMKVH